MTQSEIEHRLSTSGLPIEDQLEIARIFDRLSDERKLALFENWSVFIARMLIKREILNSERIALITDPLDSLIEGYDALLARIYEANTRSNLKNLQTNI